MNASGPGSTVSDRLFRSLIHPAWRMNVPCIHAALEVLVFDDFIFLLTSTGWILVIF